MIVLPFAGADIIGHLYTMLWWYGPSSKLWLTVAFRPIVMPELKQPSNQDNLW